MALSLAEKAVYARTINTDRGLLAAATAGGLGTTTNAVTCYTAGAYGGRIESIAINTDDTAAVNVFLSLVDGAGTKVHPLGIVAVPANSGNSSTVIAIDALDGAGIKLNGMLIDSTNKRYISIPAGYTLRASVLANMTAAKNCWVTVQGFDYTALT